MQPIAKGAVLALPLDERTKLKGRISSGIVENLEEALAERFEPSPQVPLREGIFDVRRNPLVFNVGSVVPNAQRDRVEHRVDPQCFQIFGERRLDAAEKGT
jgi:hypothetical protein